MGTNSKEYMRQYRVAHPRVRTEQEKARGREALAAYRAANPEKIRAQRRAYHATVTSTEEGARENAARDHACYARNWFRKLIYAAKTTSMRRGHGAISVTEAHLQALFTKQNGRCYWTGLPMNQDSNSPWKISLDRLDNTRTYEPENVVLCGWFINRARGLLTVSQFVEVLKTLGWACQAAA